MTDVSSRHPFQSVEDMYALALVQRTAPEQKTVVYSLNRFNFNYGDWESTPQVGFSIEHLVKREIIQEVIGYHNTAIERRGTHFQCDRSDFSASERSWNVLTIRVRSCSESLYTRVSGAGDQERTEMWETGYFVSLVQY